MNTPNRPSLLATGFAAAGLALAAPSQSEGAIVVLDYESADFVTQMHIEDGWQTTTENNGVPGTLLRATNADTNFALAPQNTQLLTTIQPIDNDPNFNTLADSATISLSSPFGFEPGEETPVGATITLYGMDGNVLLTETWSSSTITTDSSVVLNIAASDVDHLTIGTPNGHIQATFDDVSFSSTRTVPVVPEPASIATLGIGGLALLRRRRGGQKTGVKDTNMGQPTGAEELNARI